MTDVLVLLRDDRVVPSADFLAGVRRRIAEPRWTPGRATPARTVALLAAAALLAWTLALVVGTAMAPSRAALAGDHSYRLALFLREAEQRPERVRHDYELSGLAEAARGLNGDHARLAAALDDAVRGGGNALAAARALEAHPSSVGAKPIPRRPRAMGGYAGARSLLYEGDYAGALRAFDALPEPDAGALYWKAYAAERASQPAAALAAYYGLQGSSWLRDGDRMRIADLAGRLEGQDAPIDVHPPRGSGTVRLSVRELVENVRAAGTELVVDSPILIHALLVIQIFDDRTVVEGDVQPVVLRAMRRLRAFYPASVRLAEGRRVKFEIARPAIAEVRTDPALRREMDVLRRARIVLAPE